MPGDETDGELFDIAEVSCGEEETIFKEPTPVTQDAV